MLGDPVPQHRQHPHGRRRARDGHLASGRLSERVWGGLLGIIRPSVYVNDQCCVYIISPHWEGRGDYLSQLWLRQMPRPRGQSSIWQEKNCINILWKMEKHASGEPVGQKLWPHQACSHSEKFTKFSVFQDKCLFKLCSQVLMENIQTQRRENCIHLQQQYCNNAKITSFRPQLLTWGLEIGEPVSLSADSLEFRWRWKKLLFFLSH